MRSHLTPALFFQVKTFSVPFFLVMVAWAGGEVCLYTPSTWSRSDSTAQGGRVPDLGIKRDEVVVSSDDL